MTQNATRPTRYLRVFPPAPSSVLEVVSTTAYCDLEDLGLGAGCDWQLDALARAARERRLWFQERRHRLSGEVRLLVYERWHAEAGAEMRVVAELLGVPGGTWHEQTERCDLLGWCASQEQLSVVAHGDSDHIQPFLARIVEDEEVWRISYLARLLLSDSELAQWREAR